MPDDAGIDLEAIKSEAKIIAEKAGSVGDMLITDEPVAFGLKKIIVKAMYVVDSVDFDTIAADMAKIEHVQTADVAGMDLPLG